MPDIKNVTLNSFYGRNDHGCFGIINPNLSPLNQDTISFKGADLAVIERYKPNIQQFKSKEDLQTFADEKISNPLYLLK